MTDGDRMNEQMTRVRGGFLTGLTGLTGFRKEGEDEEVSCNSWDGIWSGCSFIWLEMLEFA